MPPPKTGDSKYTKYVPQCLMVTGLFHVGFVFEPYAITVVCSSTAAGYAPVVNIGICVSHTLLAVVAVGR